MLSFTTTGTRVTADDLITEVPPEVLAVQLTVGLSHWHEGMSDEAIKGIRSLVCAPDGPVAGRHVIPWPETASWVFYQEGQSEAYCVSEHYLRGLFPTWAPLAPVVT